MEIFDYGFNMVRFNFLKFENLKVCGGGGGGGGGQ